MGVSRRDNHRRIDDRKESARICGAMTLRHTGGIQPLRIALSDKKFDRHRLQDAKMVRAPAPEADEKNSFRLLHLLSPISKVRHLARSSSSQAIDTLSALASIDRVSLIGSDIVVEEFCGGGQW